MKIELKKGYLVSNHEIIEGKVLVMETFKDGVCTYENKNLFTTDGKNFMKEDWSDKIFLDEKKAYQHLKNEKESRIKSAKNQIEYYTKRLEELKN